jgi:hypothetical protein
MESSLFGFNNTGLLRNSEISGRKGQQLRKKSAAYASAHGRANLLVRRGGAATLRYRSGMPPPSAL